MKNFTPVRPYQLRPSERRSNLSFKPHECIAPFEIETWLTNGSLEHHIKGLAARIGDPDKDNADGYLAREVMVIRLALASVLEEFPPARCVAQEWWSA